MTGLRGLLQSVELAKDLAGFGDCRTVGHRWISAGGRACPRDPNSGNSQTFYVCERCGLEDYGDPGGPGWRDCYVDGPCEPQCKGSED